MTPPAMAATAEREVSERADNERGHGARSDSARDNEPPLLDHAYDGIQEYDNPLPGWWRAIFWATIVFAAGYWVWFHVTDWGNSPQQKYNVALAHYAEGKSEREKAELRNISEDLFVRSASDSKVIEHGKEIFAARCVSCHAAEGQGLIGPNLTDRYQLHGTTRMDIFKTVRAGVPGTAMLAWGEQMPAGDVVAVATYVTLLRGKDLAGKEPQGQPVEPFK